MLFLKSWYHLHAKKNCFPFSDMSLNFSPTFCKNSNHFPGLKNRTKTQQKKLFFLIEIFFKKSWKNKCVHIILMQSTPGIRKKHLEQSYARGSQVLSTLNTFFKTASFFSSPSLYCPILLYIFYK